MTRAVFAAVGVVAGVAAWVYSRRNVAGVVSVSAIENAFGEGLSYMSESVGGLSLKLDKSFNSLGWSNMRKLKPNIDSVRYHKNVVAFLKVIRHKESNNTQSAYTLMNGGQHFTAPPWVHPGRKFPGGTSTAAGAYQFVKKTWDGIVSEVGLADFSPVNQERAAVYHMAFLGALPYVMAGDFATAIDKCNGGNGWTSLPGGGEQLQTMAEAASVFTASGGRLA